MREMKDSGVEWIGEIPKEWEVTKLKNNIFCLDGMRRPVDAALRVDGPYPYWGAGSVTDYVDDFIFDEELVLLGEDGAPFFDPSRPVSFLINERVECLQVDILKGSALSEVPLFYTVDNTFFPAEKVVAFSGIENVNNQREVFSVLEHTKSLFIPTKSIELSNYGIEVISSAYAKVFDAAISNPTKTALGFKILMANEHFDIRTAVSKIYRKELTIMQLAQICKEEKLRKVFLDESINAITKMARPQFSLKYPDSNVNMKQDFFSEISEIMETATPSSPFNKYLEQVNNTVYTTDLIDEAVGFPFSNGLLLTQKEVLPSFAAFGRYFDPKRTFTTAIELAHTSKELNSISESIPEDDYILLLSRIRNNQRQAFGGSVLFSKYISLINDSSVDPYKFIQELLQNADDCSYDNCITEPEFRLHYDKDQLVIGYSEDGFSKDDVRALTAIGESTKKRLLSDKTSTIGEKGVGFKSVFAIASSVEIDSGNFHFTLDDRKIIVPSLRRNGKYFPGTRMSFTLKEKLPPAIWNQERVLSLCLCLRNLKILYFNSDKIEIVDDENGRTVSYNGKMFIFKKTSHSFIIEDEQILAGREKHGRKINRNLSVNCYTPVNFHLEKYPVYCGLPSSVTAKIPMIIDAPFETNTSRDGVLHNTWNDHIRSEVYKAIIAVIHAQKRTQRVS